MSRSNKSLAKATWQESSNAYRVADKGITHFARWATTDHTGLSQSLSNMPKMGFMDSCHYVVTRFVIAVIASLIGGLLVFILIAFGLPALLNAALM